MSVEMELVPDGGVTAARGFLAGASRAADFLLPDTYQCGGLWAVKRIAEVAEAARVPCIVHCAHDLGPKTAAMLHLAASTANFPLANDCTYYGLEDDVITPLHRVERGLMPVPEGPGLGVVVDEAKLKKYRM
jgi:L-alanine-DL-glutamate epimerase-like enolase superfamily enzyme